MATYVVHFDHFAKSHISAQVPVPMDIDPTNAADQYELIVTTAYGLLDSDKTIGGSLIDDVNDLVAMKITHGADVIASFDE